MADEKVGPGVPEIPEGYWDKFTNLITRTARKNFTEAIVGRQQCWCNIVADLVQASSSKVLVAMTMIEMHHKTVRKGPEHATPHDDIGEYMMRALVDLAQATILVALMLFVSKLVDEGEVADLSDPASVFGKDDDDTGGGETVH